MPAKWELRLVTSADRDVARLPRGVVAEAVATIEDLAEDPFPPGVITMRRYNHVYRVRFANDAYRIVYRVDLNKHLILVLRVRPRPSAYVGMKAPD